MLITRKFIMTCIMSSAMLAGTSICSADLAHDLQNQATEAKLELGLLLKRGVPSAAIDVHVNDKVIQLAGFVDNKEQYLNVKSAAAKYEGKYKIMNDVIILASVEDSGDDDRLVGDIKKQLRTYQYPLESIDVQVRRGHVILSGFVNKSVSLNKIKSVTLLVRGATVVDNNILYKS